MVHTKPCSAVKPRSAAIATSRIMAGDSHDVVVGVIPIAYLLVETVYPTADLSLRRSTVRTDRLIEIRNINSSEPPRQELPGVGVLLLYKSGTNRVGRVVKLCVTQEVSGYISRRHVKAILIGEF